ncbi:polyadenylate-binding protein 2-like [Hibiscus syriacus]|uniref:polyadenylate-binding protein 2-like n=1 Tax=Hibiscus syriacus TaxID=106335 RepID=UPI001924F852|nr:polyadenylate-binding protein 2-like [Hibiscus syriacus]
MAQSLGKEGVEVSLFVQNIPPSYHWSGLRQLFGRHGDVISSYIARKNDRTGKRFDFVRFSNRDDSVRAVQRLNGFWIEQGYNDSGKSAEVSARRTRLVQGEVDEDIVRKLQKSLVGTMVAVCSSRQVEDKLQAGGLGEIKTKFLGGRDYSL